MSAGRAGRISNCPTGCMSLQSMWCERGRPCPADADGGGASEPEAANPEVVRLVALARTGDRAAFGRLIEDHLTAARRVALAAVGQAMDADEAVQDASVAAWTRLHALQDPAAFRGWFMRIVWRKAIDRRRSMRSWLDRFGVSSSDDRPMEFPAAEPSPDALLISRELEIAISASREGAAEEAPRSVPARGERRSSLRRDRDAAGRSDRHGEVAHLRSAPVDPHEARSPRATEIRDERARPSGSTRSTRSPRGSRASKTTTALAARIVDALARALAVVAAFMDVPGSR